MTDATTRELIFETRRDVAWIRETLEEIKTALKAQDKRLTLVENRQHQWIGRDGAIAAAISAVVAFLTALVSGGCLR